MVRQNRAKKLRSGRGKVKLKNRSWKRWDPNPKIGNSVVRKNWDPSKSPAANLAEMGFQARPNRLDNTKADKSSSKTAAKSHVIELFDVPESDRPSRQQRHPLDDEEQEYMARLFKKHGDNYTKMFRDTKTNNMQHTEEKLRKMGARFLLLSPAQRRVPVPDKVQHLVPDAQRSDE